MGIVSASQLAIAHTSRTGLQYVRRGKAYVCLTAAHLVLPLQLQDPISVDSRNAELMRNFVERTSLELDLVIDRDTLWQCDAVQASVTFPFLRHALMALSGLHICHMYPPNPQSYYNSACQHSVRASKLFRISVTNVTKHNWQPVLTFLIASVIFSLDISLLGHTFGDPNHTLSPAFILLILRTPGFLSTQLISRLLSGSLAATLLRRQNRLRIPVDGNVTCVIQSLARFCEAHLASSPDAQAYIDAIVSLGLWVKKISCQPQSWHDLVGWPVTTSDDYIDILQRRDEFAVVIFVHWCAVMNRAPGRYYLAGVMRRMEELATTDLDTSWNALLEWPRKELQSEPGLLFGWMV